MTELLKNNKCQRQLLTGARLFVILFTILGALPDTSGKRQFSIVTYVRLSVNIREKIGQCERFGGCAPTIRRILWVAMSSLTLEKVAELAGVSRSTVSRVVNDQVGVRDDVRRRVLQVIEETGYRPNIAARALASNRSGIISLVVPHAFSTLYTDPF